MMIKNDAEKYKNKNIETFKNNGRPTIAVADSVIVPIAPGPQHLLLIIKERIESCKQN